MNVSERESFVNKEGRILKEEYISFIFHIVPSLTLPPAVKSLSSCVYVHLAEFKVSVCVCVYVHLFHIHYDRLP